jgi:uncharacterized membrane protein YkvA (DUF1232 family)
MNKQNITEKLVGEARKGSLWSPRSIVFYLLAIVYTLSPIDFIPDAMLGPGLVDDAAVIIAVIYYIIRIIRKKKTGK